MGTMRGGMGMGMKAERSSGGRAGRGASADLPKEKGRPEEGGSGVWALMAPRKGSFWLGFA